MIGELRLPNRLIIEPTTANLDYYGGFHSPIQLERYKMYGRSGAGLVILECTTVDENAIQFPGGPWLTDDKFIPGLSVIADLINEMREIQMEKAFTTTPMRPLLPYRKIGEGRTCEYLPKGLRVPGHNQC